MEWVDRKVLQQLADDIGQEMLPVVITVFIEEVGGAAESAQATL